VYYRYNAREIGTFVGMQIVGRHLLLPFPAVHQKALKPPPSLGESKSNDKSLYKPRFSLPRAVEARLPADTFFVSAQLPRAVRDTVALTTDSAAAASFGPICPRRITSLKVQSQSFVLFASD
jgi:hypothetical protein